MEQSFQEMMIDRNRRKKLHLCVGLDPDLDRIMGILGEPDPGRAITTFNYAVMEATQHVAAWFKPNLWFYLATGLKGLEALIATIAYAEKLGVPAVVDSKFGDIGNTSERAGKFLFEVLRALGSTVNCYLGGDAIQPVIDRKDRANIVICKTSNPGSVQLQDRWVSLNEEDLHALLHGPVRQVEAGDIPGLLRDGDRTLLRLWHLVALQVANHWNTYGNCGLVVGATFPEALSVVRASVGPDMPILNPGVGAQKGALEESVAAAVGDEEEEGLFVVNVSRGILNASEGSDFAEAAGAKAEGYHQQIEAAIESAKAA